MKKIFGKFLIYAIGSICVISIALYLIFYRDLSVHVISDFVWDNIYLCDDGAVVVKDNLYGYMDLNGEMVIPLQNKKLHATCSGLRLYKNGGLYGYKDCMNKIIISAQYADASDFTEGFAVVRDDKNKVVVINKNNEKIAEIENGQNISTPFNMIRFKNGKALVQFNINDKHQQGDLRASCMVTGDEYKYFSHSGILHTNGKVEKIEGYTQTADCKRRYFLLNATDRSQGSKDEGTYKLLDYERGEIRNLHRGNTDIYMINNYAIFCNYYEDFFEPYIVNFDTGEKKNVQKDEYRQMRYRLKYIEEKDTLISIYNNKLVYYKNNLKRISTDFGVEAFTDSWGMYYDQVNNFIPVMKDDKWGVIALK